MSLTPLYYDALGTDGSDPAKMAIVMDYYGQEVRIPGDTPQDQWLQAVLQRLGLTQTEHDARASRLADLRDNAAAALAAIEDDMAARSADSSLWPGATTAERMDILLREMGRSQRAQQIQRRTLLGLWEALQILKFF